VPGVEFTNGDEPGVKLRAKKDSAMPEWLAWVLLLIAGTLLLAAVFDI